MTAPCPAIGFLVAMDLAPALTAEARDALWRAWTELLETHGLYCGGGGGYRLEYVVASEAAQATANDRAAISAWLGARAELRAWRVGALMDLNEAV